MSESAFATASQDADQGLLEVVRTVTNLGGDTVFIDLPRSIDVLPKTVVEVRLSPAALDLVFVVELDLRDQEPGQPPGLLMDQVVARGVLTR